jgi:pimeloyl-ACP methyl ester carboxylesterase
MQFTPYFREAGSGPGVVCLHSNASASAQWKMLMERLAPQFHVLAPDTLGAGRSPAWPADRAIVLDDEVALLEPIFEMAGAPFHLVGHSYGAAIALRAALTQPARVKTLCVYEPTLFSLLEEEAPGQPAARGIQCTASDAAALVEAGQPLAAAERFIDYWMGHGSWSAMPAPRQQVVAGSMANIGGWARALWAEDTPLQAFRSLDLPVLYMIGGRSPDSSRGVARLLTGVLPNVSTVQFDDLGHMAPVTDPERINEAILRFLMQHRG